MKLIAETSATLGSWRLTSLSGAIVFFYSVMYLYAWKRRRVQSQTDVGGAAQVSFRGSLILLAPLYFIVVIGFVANILALIGVI